MFNQVSVKITSDGTVHAVLNGVDQVPLEPGKTYGLPEDVANGLKNFGLAVFSDDATSVTPEPLKEVSETVLEVGKFSGDKGFREPKTVDGGSSEIDPPEGIKEPVIDLKPENSAPILKRGKMSAEDMQKLKSWHIDGMSNAKIAESLGRTEGYIESKLTEIDFDEEDIDNG